MTATELNVCSITRATQAASPSSGSQWRVPPACDFLWRFWDGECVVFNASSADTHVLDEFSGKIVQNLQQGPATVSGLLARLTQAYALPAEALSHSALEALLTQLYSAGLIEPVLG